MNGTRLTPKPFGFIQARLSSTRLSGKILECIPKTNGPTLLDHIYLRLRKVIPSEQIVFLIPEGEKRLSNFLMERGYQFFIGSMENVRDRYIKAAEFYKAKDIIRLTGDNPFIDVTSIELLWEAMFYVKNPNYCLSIQGLPLGMGVECFSYSALVKNIDKYNELRHREHVSLHIKEDLDDNAVYRLRPPHLTEDELANTSKIRMTIDEDLDLQVMRDVWNQISNSNPFFEAKDVIRLYNSAPKLFETNQPVSQIQFDLPKEITTKKRISLTYGDPKVFGSGHFERCKSLSIEIQMNGFEVHSNPSEMIDFDGYIVDARETKPSGFPALAIDNLALSEDRIVSVNFLPHPNLENQNKNELSFYSSPMIEIFKSKSYKPGHWLVYAGSLEQSICEKLDEYLLHQLQSKWQVDAWTRVGGSLPKSNLIKYIPRLTKYEYFEILSQSDGFISYFGQSIMESLYLGKKTALFGMTDIHTKLGIYFAKKANLIYLGEPGNFLQPLLPPAKIKFNIQRNAQQQIIKWLETL